MKKFILNFSLFASLLLGLLITGFLLPATTHSSQSPLFANLSKHDRLKNTSDPRIIFIGGSNLSFGLNSQIIKDSLHLNPINMGLHAVLGLEYMINSVKDEIREGDIVVLAPEYAHFYGDFMFGGRELIQLIGDTKKKDILNLSFSQYRNIAAYLPKYALSKFNPFDYASISNDTLNNVNAFNKYGDVDVHWQMKQQEFEPFPAGKSEFNPDAIKFIVKTEQELSEIGAKLFVVFPGLQASSFDNMRLEIYRVERALKQTDLVLLGSAERYKIPDSMVFNTPYHLLKSGVDYRTSLLIEDLKKVLKN